MALKDSPSLDHIDPTWEEGRDYQLVCGLDCARNWRELTYSENSAKGVRFLPWRYCEDEIGVKPVESGDLCQFLNPETEEWELMEFEGKRWWELSKQFSNHYRAGKRTGAEHAVNGTGFCNAEARANAHKAQKEKGTGFYDPEVQRSGGMESYRQKKGLHAPGIVTFETCQQGGLKGGRTTSSQKWKCLKTGHITNAGALTCYQKHRNIDVTLRERVL
jgi:hypothetical protein